MLRTIDQDQDLEQCVIDGFNTAGPLLMITTHLLVAQTLMHNPEDYVERRRGCRPSKQLRPHFQTDERIHIGFSDQETKVRSKALVDLGHS